MSTPSERLEAEVWLDTTRPDLSADQQDAFFAAVDEYYDEHPTADRGSDFLAMLREDDRAFAHTLDAILTGEGRQSVTADTADVSDAQE